MISEHETRRVIERSLECVNRSRLLLDGVIERSNAGSPVVWVPSLAAAESTGSDVVCGEREQPCENPPIQAQSTTSLVTAQPDFRVQREERNREMRFFQPISCP
ncbi:MAG TPA: hypothetical protein VHC72_09325 [Bryobacteraceae bacterium]|nr:hypothetical protein [Bryobacteraceae bacterium]